MKKIWEGNITDEKMAWQLHCLVAQIHDWAVKTFRPFILDHLEAWNRYLRASQTPFCVQDLGHDIVPALPQNLDR
jgi:hypothetical protein